VKKIAFPVYIMALCALLAACGNPNQRLDEYVFYDGPQFKLKVVRYYRNIPFNQLGEHAVVMCQSENTMKSPAHERQDAGWRMLGAADALDSKNAEEAALRLKDAYSVIDDRTLIAKTNVFNISFDACGHFINWDPGRLPQDLINPVEKPDSCAPNGPADCRYYDFEGDRAPRYEQIHVADKGQVSFTASSPTFKDVELLRIQTRNNGAVWHVETVRLDKQGLDLDIIRLLPMSLLEKGMGETRLVDWLESVLPPRSMVIWMDEPVACGDQRCAEILFNDSEGNNGTLYIAINTDSNKKSGEVSFHSGTYDSGNKTRPLVSLDGLRESLASGAE